MGKDIKVKLTTDEGQQLFLMASNFVLPKKLGDQAFSVADRGVAADEVRALFRAMKGYSPYAQTGERRTVFGPKKCWEEIKDGEKVSGHRMLDHDHETEVRLSEDAVSGVVWLLLLAIHPQEDESKQGREIPPFNVGAQDLFIWPVAEKVKKVKAIREFMGMNKAAHRRWDDDPEEKVGEKAVEAEKQETSK